MKKRCLFISSHTFYLKSLLPLILVALENKKSSGGNFEIFLEKNRPDWWPYHPRRYSQRPIENVCVNKKSAAYVATLGEISKEWTRWNWNLRTVFGNFGWSRKMKWDRVVGTVKDLDRLIEFKRQGVPEVYAIGYQHYPVVLSLCGKLAEKKDRLGCKQVFLGSGAFAEQHRFSQVIQHSEVEDYEFAPFPYLDFPWLHYHEYRARANGGLPKTKVLVFHPGGYRGVISEQGMSRSECDVRQKTFIKKVCGPLLLAGYEPVIKIHPLAAQFHFREDMERLVSELAAQDPMYENVEVIDQSFWKAAFDSAFILAFGSASFYELFSMGVSQVLVGNFLGRVRSKKFEMFENRMISTQEEYEALLKSPEDIQRKIRIQEGEEKRVFEAYSGLMEEYRGQFSQDLWRRWK